MSVVYLFNTLIRSCFASYAHFFLISNYPTTLLLTPFKSPLRSIYDKKEHQFPT